MDGLIDQEEYFNKIVASKSLKNYYLLNKGEFAYNKSYSNGYPYGAVKRLDFYENGAVSTLYICFKPKDNINSDFLKIYFETDKWYKEIYKIAVEGARNHGLLNISINDFFNTHHYLPSLNEQKKISNFINILSKKIKLLEDKYEDYNNLKRFFLQNMFPSNTESAPKLRFEEFVGEWNLSKLGDLATIKGRIGFRGYNKSDLVGENEGALTIGGKHISSNNKLDLKDPEYLSWEKYEESPEIKVYENDVLLVSTASVGKVAFIENLNKPATINPQLVVLKNIKINNKYLYYYLCTDKFQKNLFKVTSKTVIPTVSQNELKKLPIIYPKFKEQEKIINILSFIDKKIEMIENIIEKTEEFKKGLLQQMFVEMPFIHILILISYKNCYNKRVKLCVKLKKSLKYMK